MSTTTAFKNLQEKIEEVLKCNDVAEIAGVDFDVWQYHIFYGVDNRFNLGKNRGRTPFIEWELDTESYTPESIDGGLNQINTKIRFHAGKKLQNRDKLEAQLLIKSLIDRILSLIRSEQIASAGEDDITVSIIESSPWGFRQEMMLPVDLSYCRTTFGETDE